MTTIMAAASFPHVERQRPSSAKRQDAAADRQSAWQREMEREQLQTWLHHTLPSAAMATQPLTTQTDQPWLAAARWSPGAQPASDNQLSDSHGSSRPETSATMDAKLVQDSAIDVLHRPLEQRGDSTITAQSALASGDFFYSPQAADASVQTRLTALEQGWQQLLGEAGLPSMPLTLFSGGLCSLLTDGPNLLVAQRADHPEEKTASACGDGVFTARQEQALTVALRFHTEANGNVARIWIGADSSAQLNQEKLTQLSSAIQRLLSDQGIVLASLTLNGTVVFQGAIRQPVRGRDASQYTLAPPSSAAHQLGLVHTNQDHSISS